ncbi:hypothetical protein VNI00_001007 [Paramarasmius palmivorus]|uniref:Transmembrane protein n=1 Tax=Paramarasmius palmivorus TaxID=297713 RepID=A0AAW0E8E8_9AGAR
MCSALFWLQGYLNTAVIWIASTIMTLRVIAMFPQSRVIRYSALLVLVAELIAMLAILSVTLRGTRQTVLFLLAIWNAVYQLKIRKVWNRNEVLSVLIRDSIFYFFVSELSFAANAGLTLYVFKEGLYLGFRQHRTPWLQIPYSLSATANTILVARLILNLQSAFYKPTFSPTDTLTTIDWVHTANSTSTGAFEMSTSPRIPDFSNVPNSQYFPS